MIEDPHDPPERQAPESASDSGILYPNAPVPGPPASVPPDRSSAKAGGHGSDSSPSCMPLSSRESSEPERADPTLPAVGDELGAYAVIGLLGLDTCKAVYAARHRYLDRRVVITLLRAVAGRAAAEETQARRDFHAAARLEHPGIVTTLDVGEFRDAPYQVNEYLATEPLERAVRREGTLAIDSVVEIVVAVAKALHRAHLQSAVHCRLKPTKIFWDRGVSVKIVGFGVATPRVGLSDSADAGAIESWLSAMNDPRYTAPELIWARTAQRMPVGAPADVYGLGCILYHLLAGHAPYEGGPLQVMKAHRDAAIPNLRGSESGTEIEFVLQRLLAKDPQHRMSMEELAAELEGTLRKRDVLETIKSSESGTSLNLAPSASGKSSRLLVSGEAAMSYDPRHVLAVDAGAASIRGSVLRGGIPVAVSLGQDRLEMPTAVWIDHEKVWTGWDALEGPRSDIARGFKSYLGATSARLGRDLSHDARDAVLRPMSTPAEVWMAFLMRRLNELAREQVGYLRRAVLTVPGCFNDLQRKSLQDAAYIASLDVLGIINESTASAFWLAHQQGQFRPGLGDSQPRHWLIVRLGYGSFETSVVRLAGHDVQVLAVTGDPRLGLAAWDQQLADTLRPALSAGTPSPDDAESVQGALLRTAEAARVSLSQRDRVKLRGTRGGPDDIIRLTRAAFEASVAPVWDRSVKYIQHAVQASKIAPHDLDQVLVCGGGAAIECVPQTLRDLYPQSTVTVSTDPHTASHGAVVWAAMNRRAAHSGVKVTLTEANPFDVAIVSGRSPGGKLRYGRILPAHAPLPQSRKKTFGSSQQMQESLRVPLVTLNELALQPVESIGECHIWYHTLGHSLSASLDVTFQMSPEGRLSVFAENAAGVRQSLEIQRPGSLTDSQSMRWREWMDTAILCGRV